MDCIRKGSLTFDVFCKRNQVGECVIKYFGALKCCFFIIAYQHGNHSKAMAKQNIAVGIAGHNTSFEVDCRELYPRFQSHANGRFACETPSVLQVRTVEHSINPAAGIMNFLYHFLMHKL